VVVPACRCEHAVRVMNKNPPTPTHLEFCIVPLAFDGKI
jgi:hypothetical protein